MKSILIRIAACTWCVFVLLAATSTLAQQANITLADALDNTNLQFTAETYYNYPWIGQYDASHDGTDAAMIVIPAFSYNYGRITTSVTGPARVSFWSLCDSLTTSGFYYTLGVDNANFVNLNGRATLSLWTENHVDVPFGNHAFVWDAGAYGSSSQLLALLDEVTVTPLVGNPPQVSFTSSSATKEVGQPASIHADVTGSAPITYTWRFQREGTSGNFNLGNITGPDVIFSQFRSIDAGTYTCLAQNIFGTNSSSIVLTAGHQTIGEALDQPTWVWETSSQDREWFAQTNVTRNGSSCLQSPRESYSYLRATVGTMVTGPAVVKYYIKFDPGLVSYGNGPELTVQVFGGTANIYYPSDGPFDWRQDQIIVPSGDHFVEWEYGVDYYYHYGTMWIDTVTAEPLVGTAPTITNQSTDVTIEQGQPVTLSVAVSGTAPFSYHWHFNGELVDATNSTLQLYGNLPENGDFTVTVDNYFGSAQSDPIHVTVNPSTISLKTALDNQDLIWVTDPNAPWFGESAVTHDHHHAGQGTSVLGTTVVGPGVLTFWWKATAGIELYDSTYETFTDAVYNGNGEWQQASVGIPAGPRVLTWYPSEVAWLDQVKFTAGTVAAPVIAEQPHSLAVDPGSPAAFSVKVKGVQPLFYQWTFNGQNIDGANDSAFTVPSTSSENFGYYAVTIYSPFATLTSDTVVLSAKSEIGAAIGDPGSGWTEDYYGTAPGWFIATNVTLGKHKVIQSAPSYQDGSSSEFNTVVGPGTLSFWWKVSSETNADVLQFWINDSVQTSISGNTRWQHYTCHIATGAQTVSWTYEKDSSVSVGKDCGWLADVQFTADPPPTIHIVPHVLEVYEGWNARFDTVCNSTNPPTIWWTASSPRDFDALLYVKLPEVSLSDNGWFQATVASDSGTSSDTAFLHVRPAIEGRRVMAGSSVALKVHYPAKTIPGLNWTQNDNPLTDGGRFHGTSSTVLRISSADPSDNGQYGILYDQGADEGIVPWWPTGALAVVPRGAVVGWGIDEYYGSEIVWPSDITEALSIVTDETQSAAVLPDGTVRTWGNYDGTSFDVPYDVTDVTAVALRNQDDFVALKKDGTTIEWSSGGYTIPLRDGVNTTRAISASGGHVLLLDRDGTVFADGSNDYGESDVPSDLKGVTAIAAGNGYSLALLRSGKIVGWGDNYHGQLMPPHGTVAMAIAAGRTHALALLRDGTVVGWGDNTYGQISVPRGLNKVVAIAAGAKHSVALTSDGRVVTWGGEYNGNLKTASVPVGLRNVAGIAAGGAHTLALKFAPDIVSEPVAQSDEDPQFSLITVQASGRSPLLYSWRLNGSVISTTSTPSLRVTTPPGWSAAMQRHYDVIVHNPYGSAVSQHVTVPPLDGSQGLHIAVGSPSVPPIVIPIMPVLPSAPHSLVSGGSATKLSIAGQSNTITLSWTDTPGGILECADDLFGTFSTNGVPDALASGTNWITLPISSKQKFYRLRVGFK